MKIEISKKQLIISIVTIVVIAASVTIGYFIGYGKGVASMENPKGNGNHFYSEILEGSGINDHIFKYHKILYHSTTLCPNIKGGVDMDSYGYTEGLSGGDVPYYFCPICMDDILIELCDHRVKETLGK